MNQGQPISDELIEALLNEYHYQSNPDMTPKKRAGLVGESQRARTIAQGLTLGGADEIEAFVRSPFSDQSYGDILGDVRGKVDTYRENNPGRATMDEIGGALIPSVAALAAAPFTGGGSAATAAPTAGRLIPQAAKLAGIGAAEGAAYGFMSDTGGDASTLWEQALNRTDGMAFGAGTGAIAGPLGAAAMKGAGRGLSAMIDFANRQFGPRVGKAAERELQRVINESGLTMDEAVARIESGELLAEANKTLQTVARGYYAKSTGAAKTLSDTFSKRPDDLRKETMDYLQSNMTEGADPNVLRQFQMDDATIRQQKSADYNRAFAEGGQVSDDVAANIADAFRRVPTAANELNTLFRAETGEAPFFRIKDGNVVFDRNPTLEEADIFYRGIRDHASSLYKSGSGGAGGAVKNVAEGVKGSLDAASPALANVRKEWSGLETAKDAFDEGRKALARSPDEVAIEFDRVTQLGDGAVKAYRAGVMDAYRRKASTGTNKSLPRLISDGDRKEGAILRLVFPGDNLDEMLAKSTRAAKAQEASNQILGGSQTAITQGRSQQIGGSLIQDGIEAATGSPTAAFRVAGQVVKGLRPGMTDKDVQQVAKMLVESDPEAFRKMAIGTGTSDAIVRLADRALRQLENASAQGIRRGVQPVQQGIFPQ